MAKANQMGSRVAAVQLSIGGVKIDKNAWYQKQLASANISKPDYLKKILNSLSRALDNSEILSLEVCSKLEDLLLSNSPASALEQNAICALLLKIADSNKAYKFKDSSLEIFSQKLTDRVVICELQKNSSNLLQKEIFSNQKSFSSSEATGNLLNQDSLLLSNFNQQPLVSEDLNNVAALTNDLSGAKNLLKQQVSLEKKDVLSAVVDNKQAILQANAAGDDRNLADNGHEAHYWYSIGDIDCLLLHLRKTYLHYQRTPNFGEEYISVRENTDGVFLADSYTTLNFASNLSDDVVKIISGVNTRGNVRWNSMPTTIIIPMLSDLHWRVVNIEINYEAKTAFISLNDPYGANGFSNELKAIIQQTVKANVQLLIRKSSGDNNFSFTSNLPVLEETTNQQGDDNGWDCGPISFSNVKDYLEFATHLKAQLEFTIGANNEENHAAKIKAVRNADIVIYRQISSGIDLPARLAQLSDIQKPILEESPILPKTKLKNTDELFEELSAQNTKNKKISEFIYNNKLKNSLVAIDKNYQNDAKLCSQGLPINLWQADHISTWAEHLKADQQLALDEDFLTEAIAIAKRANFLKTGNHLRETQAIAILSLFEAKDQGLLLQIATGEGKSTTTAITALIRTLQGHKVDIVTSSPILAQRDALSWQDFFAMFNVSCGDNTQKDYVKGAKACYAKNIVYGDAHSFQCDILRDEYKNLSTLGGRNFARSYVLIDEVDSMLIDEATKIAKIASPLPGFEYLAPLLVACWSSLEKMLNKVTDNEKLSNNWPEIKPEITKELSLYLKALINGDDTNSPRLLLPKHLENFAISQCELWANSAVKAWAMSQKRDYLIVKSENKQIIAPIDYANTGIIQANTIWPDGLHQFLQIKHNLKISSESVSTCFLSNIAFFKRYDPSKIGGMTGTIGSSDAQQLLRETYNIELGFIPTFKTSRFVEIPGIVAKSEKEWLGHIKEQTLLSANSGRAALIIAETIADTEEIKNFLSTNYNVAKIKNYITGEEQIEQVQSGEIIIATNIAGRGTDLETSKQVEQAGGLFVCLSFLPANLRVEKQALGRTARKGEAGSGQLIINEAYEKLKFSEVVFPGKAESLADFKTWRDLNEQARLSEIKTKKIAEITNDDQLFSQFSSLTNNLRNSNDLADKLVENKFSSLEERWGLWLKERNKDYVQSSFEDFKNKVVASFNNGNKIIQNPVYLTRAGHAKLGEGNKYDASISLFKEAILLDDIYNFAAEYNLSYAFLRRNYDGKKNHQPYIDEAYEHLALACQKIQNYILPQLQLMQLMLGPKSNNSAFSEQVNSKINLLSTVISHSHHALEFIQKESDGKKLLTIKSYKLLYDLFNGSGPNEEISELGRYGLYQIFEVKALKPPVSWDVAIGVTILGIAQIVAGVMIAVGTLGAEAQLAAHMIIDGAKDIYHGIRVGMGKESLSWGDYWLEKSISYACYFIMRGASSFSASREAAKLSADQLAEKAAQEAIKKAAAGSIFKQVGIEIAKSLAVEGITHFAMKGIAKVMDSYKDDLEADAHKKIIEMLREPELVVATNNILFVDQVKGGVSNNGQKLILSSAARQVKGSKLEEVTKKLVSSASSGYSKGAKAVVTAGSMALSAAEVLSAVDKFCAALSRDIKHIESALPGFSELLAAKMGSATAEAAPASRGIEQYLRSTGLLREKYQLDSERVKALESGSSSGSQAKGAAALVPASQSSYSSPFVVADPFYALTFLGQAEQQQKEGHLRFLKALSGTMEAAKHKDYAGATEQLAASLSRVVAGKVSSVIQGGLIAPLVSEVAGLSVEALSPIINSGVSLLERGLTSLTSTPTNSQAQRASLAAEPGANRAEPATTKAEANAEGGVAAGEGPLTLREWFSSKPKAMPASAITANAVDKDQDQSNGQSNKNQRDKGGEAEDIVKDKTPQRKTCDEQNEITENSIVKIRMLDIHPETKAIDAKHCIFLIHDATIEKDEQGKLHVDKKYLGIMSNGHVYLGIGKAKDGWCELTQLQDLYGKNPITPGSRKDKGKILVENERFKKALDFDELKNENQKALIIKALPYPDIYHPTLMSLVKGEPSDYNVLSDNCIDFADEVIKAVGLQNVRTSDIIKPSEINYLTATKIDLTRKSVDHQIVSDISKEAVAKKYNVDIDRVSNFPMNPFADELLPNFIISPLIKDTNASLSGEGSSLSD